MKYDVQRSCGHDEVHDLFRSAAERQRKIRWLKSTPCESCYREEQKQNCKTNSEMAAKTNQARKAALLLGSVAQVNWAETIRQAVFNALDEALAGKTILLDAKTKDRKRVWKSVSSQLLAIPEASWWIGIYKSLLDPVNPRKTPSTHTLLTEFVAHCLSKVEDAHAVGITTEVFSRVQIAKARANAVIENKIKVDSFIAKGRAIGLKGRVKIWRDGKGSVSIFADDFSFTAEGRWAGKLENETKISNKKIVEFCKEVLDAWPKTQEQFYC